MSSLWTPGGERPVGPPQSGGAAPPGGGADSPDDEELAAQVDAMRAELARTPVEVVVGNHCYGLFELAAVYLSQVPPMLDRARLAIDALACLVEGLEGRLGEAEEPLREGLSQLRLAYVQIDAAQRAGAESAAATGANGNPTEGPGSPTTDDAEG